MMKSENLILVIGRAVQALITIASFRLLTSLISPHEVGNFYLVMSICSLFSMFLLNPVVMYLNRKLFIWHDGHVVFEHFLGFNFFALAVSIFAYLCVLISQPVFGVGSGLPTHLFALLVSVYIYVLNWNQNILPALNAFGHKRPFVAFTLATLAAGLLFSALFSHIFSASAISWIAGQTVAMGLVTVLSAVYFRRKITEPDVTFSGGVKYFRRESISAIAAFSVPLSGATFFMWAQAQSYRVIVENHLSSEFLAYVAVGFSIATSVAGILESLVQQIYMPAYYRAISGGGLGERQRAFSDLAEKTIPVYILYLFFIVGASEYLVALLVDPRYRDVYVYARYAAFIEFFRMTTNILASAAHSEMRTKALIKPYFAGGVCAVLTTAFAVRTSAPEIYVPLSLLISGFVTLSVMRNSVNSLIAYRFEAKSVMTPLCYSLLFLPFIWLHAGSLVRSLGLLSVCGLCFAGLQYKFSRRWLSVPEGSLKRETPIATGQDLPAQGQAL